MNDVVEQQHVITLRLQKLFHCLCTTLFFFSLVSIVLSLSLSSFTQQEASHLPSQSPLLVGEASALSTRRLIHIASRFRVHYLNVYLTARSVDVLPSRRLSLTRT